MAIQCVIKPNMWLGLRQILLYVALILCVLLQVCRSKTQLELKCPDVCHCDLYAQRNRAICSAKRLISANIEMPKTVELLDLSYNDITNIDVDSLQSTVHLINLTLAHNAIHTVHLDAFVALRHLYSLDLSYNRLEQIDKHLLETNTQLLQLSLEGNKLSTLGNEPLLRSTSLRFLNLRNAQINQVGTELLSDLPQLRQLDLAQNMLLTVSISAFHAPHHLVSLNLDENPLNCDRALVEFQIWLTLRGVVASMSDCLDTDWRSQMQPPDVELNETVDEPHKLERMENLESDITGLEVSKSVSDIWRELPDDSEEQEEQQLTKTMDVCVGHRDQLCQRYQRCLEHSSHAPGQLPSSHNFKEDDVKLAFAVGAGTGICMVIFIISCALCVKSSCELRKKRQQTINTDTISQIPEPPTLGTYLTPRIRHPRHSNPTSRSRHSRALARQPYGPEDNFVSRLFGRPARHQYYRTINQNAATLIRSISRSNLFSSRDREHSSSVAPLPTSSRFYTEVATRPETPPPNYGDVVVIDQIEAAPYAGPSNK